VICIQPQTQPKIKDILNSKGWFMPPYITMGFIDLVARTITKKQGKFTQDDLEILLATQYDATRLASMVLNRYHQTPVINLYSQTIAEAVQAHFSGLHHIAVGGLIPVIEGAGRRLAKEFGCPNKKGIDAVFQALAKAAKDDVIKRQIGLTHEIVSMLDSFLAFIEDYFYSPTQAYPLIDGTNRHGISHGSYTDSEYGRPLNFYKTIAAVDFLTFISSLKHPHSWFVPNPTPESLALASRFTNKSIKPK